MEKLPDRGIAMIDQPTSSDYFSREEVINELLKYDIEDLNEPPRAYFELVACERDYKDLYDHIASINAHELLKHYIKCKKMMWRYEHCKKVNSIAKKIISTISPWGKNHHAEKFWNTIIECCALLHEVILWGINFDTLCDDTTELIAFTIASITPDPREPIFKAIDQMCDPKNLMKLNDYGKIILLSDIRAELNNIKKDPILLHKINKLLEFILPAENQKVDSFLSSYVKNLKLITKNSQNQQVNNS